MEFSFAVCWDRSEDSINDRFEYTGTRVLRRPFAGDRVIAYALPYQLMMKSILPGAMALLIVCSAASAQDLPDGSGKAVVQRMCSSCHALEVITGTRKTRNRWANTVDVMVSRGAAGTDDEIDQAIDYLATHFGPKTVNVNHAAAKELALIGLSAKESDAIVQYREKNGNFKTFDDLKKVPDVDAKDVDRLRDHIEF
jgi:competence protein ComEA